MDFPVDVLGSVSHQELEREAEDYMTGLRYISPDKTQSFTLNNHRKIQVRLSNVGFVPVYGGDLKHKVLALFAPEDQLTAVALFLSGRWWSWEDILTTSNPSRTGFLQVRSLGERIVLYVLNRIVYRVSEMDKPEVPFLCHAQYDFAKILWKDGHAVGFYSVKPKDSLCNNFVTQCYQLPVMDSIFVRKCYRGNGHGLEMLEDFVDSFKEDELGLKYPLSLTMYKVCSRYLSRYPADEDLLWVVEGVGGPYQRERVASKINTLKLEVTQRPAANGDHGPALVTGDLGDVEMEEDGAPGQNCLDITEDVIVVVNKPLKLIEDTEDVPVSTRTRSSDRKRAREESADVLEEIQPLKMNRLEDGEAEPTSMAAEKGEEEREECPAPGDGEAAEVPEEKLAPEEEEEGPPAQGAEEVNGDLTDNQAEEEEGKEEEEEKEGVEEGEEAAQEPEAVLENGTAEGDVEMEEEKVEMEEEEEKEEKVEEEKVGEPTQAEGAVDAAPTVSDESAAEEEAPPPSEEEPSPAPEETPPPASPAPEEPSTPGEVAEEEPPASPEPDERGEASPLKEGAEVSPADSGQETVVLLEVADLSYQPQGEEDHRPPAIEEDEQEEAKEEEAQPPAKEEDEQEEAKEKEAQPPAKEEDRQEEAKEEEEQEEAEGGQDALAVEVEGKKEEEEEEAGERSSDDAGETRAGRRKVRGGRRAPKRKSKRTSQAPAEDGHTETPDVTEEEEQEEEEEKNKEEQQQEEEEMAMTTEEEGDAVDKSSAEEEEEEPPVVDQRALRRKSKPIQSTPRAKGKRRSKT